MGREAIRLHVEQEFADRFNGRLTIETLSGNLIYRFVAKGVELYDDRGARIASIDSVIARPRWRRIAQGHIEFGRLSVYRPRLTLERDSSGTWNISRAIRPRVLPDTSAARPAIRSVAVGDLRILSGELTTANVAELPQMVRDSTVFDYTNTNVNIRDAHLSVDWQPEQTQFDVIRVSAHVQDRDFAIARLEGQFVSEEGRYHFNQMLLETPTSHIAGSGSYQPDSVGGSRAYVEISLDAKPLDSDEFRRVVPKFPLRSQVDLGARLRGPISELVVEQLSAEREGTRVSASGTLLGLPDSLDFEVSITKGQIRRRSFRALLPDYELGRFTAADSLELSVLGRGVVRDPTNRSRSGKGDFFFDLTTNAGSLSGRVSLARSRDGTSTLTSDVVAERLDLSRFAPALRVDAVLTGDISVGGGGRTLDDLAASAELDLVGSTIFGRTIDSLRVLSTYGPKGLFVESHLDQGGGDGSVSLEADFNVNPPRYAVHVGANNLDVGPLAGIDSLSSSLTAELSARFVMAGLDDIDGDLDVRFDSTRFTFGDDTRTLSPARARFALETVDSHRRTLVVNGDLAEANVHLDGDPASIGRLAALWRNATAGSGGSASGSVETEPPHLSGTAASGQVDSSGLVSASEQAGASGQAGASEPVHLMATLSRIDTKLVNAFFPGFPELTGDVTGDLSLSVTDDTLTMTAAGRGDSLSLVRFYTTEYSTRLQASLVRSNVASSLNVEMAFGTDWFSLGGSGMPNLAVTGSVSGGTGTISVRSGTGDRLGPLTLETDVTVDTTGVTLLPAVFSLSARGSQWELVHSSPVMLGVAAVSTDRLVLSSQIPGESTVQRIEIRGGVSPDPNERLFARIENLNLSEVSNVFSLNSNLGGRLGGTATLFKRQSTPVFESALSVEALRLDDRVLGDVQVSSQLQPGTSSILLDVEVSPAADTTVASALENTARITGRVLLPTFDNSGHQSRRGRFDLDASIVRADMFFFEYIFPGTIRNVTGAVSGNVHIGGDLSRPIFEADLRISDGHFLVPRFNLSMNIDGNVFVDEFGIHVRTARVTDKTGGLAVLTGDVLFNNYRYFSLNLTGQLDDFQIMDVESSRDLPFYGHIWGSGPVSIGGPISAAELRATSVRTSPRSELFIPIVETETGSDGGFIIFADSTGTIPDLTELTHRRNVLASRPRGERGFTEGMDIEINIDAPEGSTVHLVIDPLLGDVINGIGSGRVQIQRKQGEFKTFGTFQVNSGDYLFTAGEVFVRRFVIEEGGLITWDGDPTNALLEIPAAYRTRASRAGLGPSTDGSAPLIPVVVNLRITGRVSAPQVDLSLAIDRNAQNLSSSSDQEFLETILNNPQQSTEYATSVLLTNSFALTTTTSSGGDALGTGAFNSLSQLVATQLNRYLSSALPNVDFSFGVQGETTQELDITYGVALRLLDERLVIRGEGVYQGTESAANESLQGEFIVEVRVNNNVSIEIFYRREGDALAAERILTSTTGAGISYHTEFPTWRRFFFGSDEAPITDPQPSAAQTGASGSN